VSASRLFTVGHSNHDFPRLVGLLQAAGVTAVADVRSQPFSQRYPQFNRAELQAGLSNCEIVYAFLGDHLGGRPRDSSLYDADGHVHYERVRQTKAFREGIIRLQRALDDFAVALLCSEEDPLVCHRGLMISPALVEQKILPKHLRADGSIETMEDFEARLLAETKVGIGVLDGLFAVSITEEERQQMLTEAYRIQARRKGFRLRPDPSSPEFEADPDLEDQQ